jgi:hypothetical protein
MLRPEMTEIQSAPVAPELPRSDTSRLPCPAHAPGYGKELGSLLNDVGGQTVSVVEDKRALEPYPVDRAFHAMLAPSNFAVTNPEVLKKAVESGGKNFVGGWRNWGERGGFDPACGRGRGLEKIQVVLPREISPVVNAITYTPLGRRAVDLDQGYGGETIQDQP